MTNINPLVGTWSLVSCDVTDAKGTKHHPIGHDPVGYLIYTAEGRVTVNLMSRERPKFVSADPTAASPVEAQAAARSYMGYAGRYELEQDRVIHHVEVAFFPNYVGHTLERRWSVDGGTLLLTGTATEALGQAVVPRLVWRRL